MMTYDNVQIVVGVPGSHLREVLQAIAEAGAGVLGEYTDCAWYSLGVGRFKPSQSADPALGEKGEINEVAEYRIETICPRARVKAVVTALRAAHPYEEPMIYLLPLLDESQFE